MLLVTNTCILTGPNMLIILLGYIDIFQSQLQWQYKTNVWKGLPILVLTPPYT